MAVRRQRTRRPARCHRHEPGAVGQAVRARSARLSARRTAAPSDASGQQTGRTAAASLAAVELRRLSGASACRRRMWDAHPVTEQELIGGKYKGPGVEIRFGIRQGTLTLRDMQALFHCVPNCHVAEETLAPE